MSAAAAAHAIGRGAADRRAWLGRMGRSMPDNKTPAPWGSGRRWRCGSSGAGGVSSGGLVRGAVKDSRLKAASSCSAGRKPTAARGGCPGAKKATVGMLMIP